MIQFLSERISFQLKEKPKIRKWLQDVIRIEKYKAGAITFIFCSDDFLLTLNESFLNHSTYTDIITFPGLEQPKVVSGDIFISIDRVSENAKKYKQPLERELNRVMVHGILHLAGYKDKTKSDKLEMTAKEDYYLSVVSIA